MSIFAWVYAICALIMGVLVLAFSDSTTDHLLAIVLFGLIIYNFERE